MIHHKTNQKTTYFTLGIVNMTRFSFSNGLEVITKCSHFVFQIKHSEEVVQYVMIQME